MRELDNCPLKQEHIGVPRLTMKTHYEDSFMEYKDRPATSVPFCIIHIGHYLRAVLGIS